jgi:polyisoprenoid-binding protein YceI
MKYVEWVSDAAHSELNFKVKHLMISNVTGSFENFTVSVESDDDNFSNPRNLQFSAEVASIDTGNAQRDEHLKSADFFDIEEYSTISFIGTSWDKSADKNIVYGDLQIKGVTKSMSFDL